MLQHASKPPPTAPRIWRCGMLQNAAACCGMLLPLVLSPALPLPIATDVRAAVCAPLLTHSPQPCSLSGSLTHVCGKRGGLAMDRRRSSPSTIAPAFSTAPQVSRRRSRDTHCADCPARRRHKIGQRPSLCRYPRPRLACIYDGAFGPPTVVDRSSVRLTATLAVAHLQTSADRKPPAVDRSNCRWWSTNKRHLAAKHEQWT